MSTDKEVADILMGLNNFIITEVVRNHPYAASVAPDSLNTIRLLLVWDDDKKEFFIPRAFHRFGCSGSVVDNLGAGNGVCVFMNPENGELENEGVITKRGKEIPIINEAIEHPDSQILLSGIIVPNWSFVKSIVLKICNSISYLRYIGMDVAVTKNGFKIIEINSLSSLSITQQRKGFLSDSRIQKVLKN